MCFSRVVYILLKSFPSILRFGRWLLTDAHTGSEPIKIPSRSTHREGIVVHSATQKLVCSLKSVSRECDNKIAMLFIGLWTNNISNWMKLAVYVAGLERFVQSPCVRCCPSIICLKQHLNIPARQGKSRNFRAAPYPTRSRFIRCHFCYIGPCANRLRSLPRNRLSPALRLLTRRVVKPLTGQRASPTPGIWQFSRTKSAMPC